MVKLKLNKPQLELLLADFGSRDMIAMFFRVGIRTVQRWREVPPGEWDKYKFWCRGRPQPDWMPPMQEWEFGDD
jgi:hypothetical protein